MPALGLPHGPKGKLRSTLRLIRAPIAALTEWRETFGATFTVPMLESPVVMTCDPELVRQIHAVGDPELFGPTVPSTFATLSGVESLLRLSGDRHQTERKLLMPHFHGERMRGWAEIMATAGRDAFAESGSLRVLDRTRQATLDVIIRVVFGVSEPAQIERFAIVAEQWARAARPGFLFIRALQRDLLGLSAYARFRRASERLDAMLLEQIAATRSSLARPGCGEREDVVAGMLAARYDDGSAMTDGAIRDQLRTLLFAGHDTTSIVLAWALFFVARDPRVRERLLAELATLGPDTEAEAFTKLPYLGAVVDETLRLRPVTGEALRLLRKPWQLGPWQLPAGIAVAAVAPLMHGRPDIWPEPEQFRPERFLGERPSPTIYFPFGGGGRRCLGATFARFEACVILATLLREFEFTALADRVDWGRSLLLLEPLGGVPMHVRPRAAGPVSGATVQGGGGSGTTPLRV
jgi:cytochrome P450